MNKSTRISQERSAPIAILFGPALGAPLVNHPWLTVSQIVAAWAKELADARTGVYEIQDKLWHHLEKDVINGLLDDPLRNGSRVGLRVIGPGGPPLDLEGWQLYGLFRTMGEVILLSKEAVFDFARRHKLRPPSWWADASKGEIQPSLQAKLKPAPDRIVIEAI